MDFHLKGNSFSRWKYRQIDCFIAASEAIRQMLVVDGVPADRTVTVHEGRWAYCDSAAEDGHDWVGSGGIPLELLRHRSPLAIQERRSA